jgi:hypothetical protein
LASPQLRRLARGATPVVRRLVPAGRQLATFARASDPATSVLDHGIGDLLGMAEGWARAIQSRDAIGHYFRLGGQLSPRVESDLANAFIDPPASRRRKRGRHRDRPAALQTPAVPNRHAPDGPRLPLPKVPLPTRPAEGDSPVGMLLDFLLK